MKEGQPTAQVSASCSQIPVSAAQQVEYSVLEGMSDLNSQI